MSSLESCVKLPHEPHVLLLRSLVRCFLFFAESFWPQHDSNARPLPSRQTLCGGPKYGNSASRSPCGPTISPVTLPFVKDSQEGINAVVGESPAILWEGGWARGVIGQDLRQHCPSHAPGFLRHIPTRMLQRMREAGDETGIFHRLPSKVGISLRPGKSQDEE